MRRLLSPFLLLALLCACAPGNPRELRQEPGLHASITVERDIRSVYKSLRAGLDECAGPTAADLFEAEGNGWIKIAGPGFMTGEQIFLYYDLTAQGQNTTLVEGYAALNIGAWPGTVRNTEYWARGKTGCP